MRLHLTRALILLALPGLLLSGCTARSPAASPQTAVDTPLCPAPGTWHHRLDDPAAAGWEASDLAGLVQRLAEQPPAVILLTEEHDSAEDHRWQLHMLAALLGRFPGMEIGMEMVRASQQPVLDAWVSGETSAAALLNALNWYDQWGFPSGLYQPLFDFARMHGVPLHGLNVEPDTLQRVGEDGWEAVPLDAREGITTPAPISERHRQRLADLLSQHPVPTGLDRDAYLERFIRAQTVWDRGMAERLAAASRRASGPVVAIVGKGHAQFGEGIPWQLADLEVEPVIVLQGQRRLDDCTATLEATAPADGLFGLASGPNDERRQRLRLGVVLAEADGGPGLRVEQVLADSLAERSGIQAGDRLLSAAGVALRERRDLLTVLDRLPPGLALAVERRRDDATTLILLR